MPRVLITGAFGYLGVNLVSQLSANWDVVAFGHPPRNPAVTAALPSKVTQRFGDLSEISGVFASLGPLDAVIHLAGGGGLGKFTADATAAVRNNVIATLLLTEASLSSGVERLLMASTVAVYGTYRQPDGPYSEDGAVEPDELYGSIKYAAELIWTTFGRGTALRIANVYGAGTGGDFGINGAVERFARAAAAGETLNVYGTGAQRIDYVHVDDVVSAFRLALDATELPPALNVGGGAPISIADLANYCVKAGKSAGRNPSIEHVEAPSGKTWPDRQLSIQTARAVLGWEPRMSYESGITELVRSMRGPTS